MALDAIIIADTGADSVSGTSPLRLKLDGRIASIQVVLNYLRHGGQIVLPIKNDGIMSWSSCPKLNGIYLYSYLQKHNVSVELIDRYFDERANFCSLLKKNPRTVVISTTFIHSKQALRELVQDIRSLAPDIFVIVGGPFVHFSYRLLQRSREPSYEMQSAKDDFLFLNKDNEASVDLYIVSLRGEQILCEALKRIKRDRPIDDLPNSARLEGKDYSFTRQVDDVSKADEVFVDWKALPDALFQSGVVPMQASNGCPYNCAFCNFEKDRRLMCIKPVAQLTAELEAVSSRGARYVWFVDDNFRLGSGNLNDVCQRFIDEGLHTRWMSFVRASSLENVDAELLRRSGCIEVQLGLESAHPQILHNMNKKMDPAMYAEVIRKLLAAGINCSSYFIFGFPGETGETARCTREFIRSIEHPELEGTLTWSIFPFMLAPLSPIYEPEMRRRYELTGYMQNWKHKTMDSDEARKHVMRTFFELENSGIIYRDDNQDILLGLTPSQRKRFATQRHRLSKLASKGQLDREDIVNSFAVALS